MSQSQVYWGGDDDNSAAYEKSLKHVWCIFCKRFVGEEDTTLVGEEDVNVCDRCKYSISIQDIKDWCVRVRTYDKEETSGTVALFAKYLYK